MQAGNLPLIFLFSITSVLYIIYNNRKYHETCFILKITKQKKFFDIAVDKGKMMIYHNLEINNCFHLLLKTFSICCYQNFFAIAETLWNSYIIQNVLKTIHLNYAI